MGSPGSFDWHFPGRKGCGIVLKMLTIFASSFKNGLLSIFFYLFCFVWAGSYCCCEFMGEVGSQNSVHINCQY